MSTTNNTLERLSPAAGSVLPLCPTCGSKPQISVIKTCSQPDWWHARVQCPLPCLSFRDAGDERKGTAIKEATQAWASYAQGSDSVSDTPRTDSHQLKRHMAYDRLWSDFARQLEREINDLSSALLKARMMLAHINLFISHDDPLYGEIVAYFDSDSQNS